jgi:hypothetical protein
MPPGLSVTSHETTIPVIVQTRQVALSAAGIVSFPVGRQSGSWQCVAVVKWCINRLCALRGQSRCDAPIVHDSSVEAAHMRKRKFGSINRAASSMFLRAMRYVDKRSAKFLSPSRATEPA